MPKSRFLPINILDVEVTEPLSAMAESDPESGLAYGGVFCLLRHKGEPFDVLEYSFDGAAPSLAKLQQLIAERTPVAARAARPPQENDAPFASVIVATRDRAASLSVCLDSLLRQSYPAFEIVVVDNAPSTHETAELVARRYAPTGRVRYVRENHPGLGRAHNSGVERIDAQIAAFTDDDVIADPRWLESLVSNFDAEGKVGCVTGLILPAELKTRAQIWTEKHGGFGKGFERKIYGMSEHRPTGRLFPFSAGQFGSGASMAFRTAALRKIGGFDSALGAGTPARGGDDLAAFFNVVDAGFQLVYEPHAIIWHHHRRSEDGMRRQAFSYGMGLGAYLTKLVVDRPSNFLRLAAILPWGLAHMAGPTSAKAQRLPQDYPASLVWRERLGILAGCPGYLRSRAALKRQKAESLFKAGRATAERMG